MTLTGRILAGAGVTVAICSAPSSAMLNLVAIVVWPTWISVAITETLRKVITYVVTRPGRELFFTVVSQEEKYKAKRGSDSPDTDRGYGSKQKALEGKDYGRRLIWTGSVSLLWFVFGYFLPVCQSLLGLSGNILSTYFGKLLYGPMGELIILQPGANYSPSHDLLPAGSGLYLLNPSYPDGDVEEGLLRYARLAFLNSPHPLEILKDRSAYGHGGTIQRDHDMNSYLKCVRSVVRHELNQIRKANRERRRDPWWPLVLPRVVRRGSESLRRFSRRFVASKNLHLLALLLFPARLFLVGAYSFIGGFRHR